VVPVHKNGDNSDCSNYRGISFLPYKILPNIFLSSLNPYADEIMGITNVDFNK
jgi:hypothetical protein